jgi:hypothetical protein
MMFRFGTDFNVQLKTVINIVIYISNKYGSRLFRTLRKSTTTLIISLRSDSKSNSVKQYNHSDLHRKQAKPDSQLATSINPKPFRINS